MSNYEKIEREEYGERLKCEFDMMLKRIYKLPFVNNPSINKRQESVYFLDRLRNKTDQKLLLFMAPAGSVALGIATKKSDVDGVCFFSDRSLDEKERALAGSSISFLEFYRDQDKRRKMFGEIEFLNVDKVVSKDHIKKQDELDLFVDVLLFAPVINELSNPFFKKTIDGYRARFLRNLLAQGEDFSKQRWKQIQDEFALKFANYGDFDVDKVDRRKKLFKVFKNYLKKTKGDIRWSDKAVNMVIDSWRDKVKLPGLEDMCLAFEV